MYKHEMDQASIVEDTKRSRLGLQTDGRTDEQSETSILPPLNFVGEGNNKNNAATVGSNQINLPVEPNGI